VAIFLDGSSNGNETGEGAQPLAMPYVEPECGTKFADSLLFRMRFLYVPDGSDKTWKKLNSAKR
jgi:hypothetical protein